MNYRIHKAVVVGSGTMGAALAAHLANAGIFVTLLDIVPDKLNSRRREDGSEAEGTCCPKPNREPGIGPGSEI